MILQTVSKLLALGTANDDSPESLRIAGLVNGLSVVGIIFLLSLGINAAVRGFNSLATTDFIAAAALAALLAYFWTTGNLRIVAPTGVFLMGVTFAYLLISGGEDQTAFVWYYSFPLLATFVLGARKGLIASMILIAVACAYFVIDPIAPGWADYHSSFEIRFVASYVMIAIFSFHYERVRSASAGALAKQTVALTATVADLTATKENLSAMNDRLRGEVRQRMEAVGEMEAAGQEAQRANEAKSQFLANMSHELRTPLNHVIGFSEVVLSGSVGELNKTQEEYLGDVVSSSRHLLSIINDVLDLARVESGKTKLDYTDVDPKALLRDSIKIVADQAESKGVKLEVSTDNLPDSLVVDERLIRQVLYNLLQNAVKFTDESGRVKLSGGLSRITDEKTIFVSVSDTGVGLDPGDLARVFDDFEQVAVEHYSPQGGTGLGLALCRRFVEMHGGRIWAESDGAGSGTTFTFSIPVHPKEIA